MHLLLFHYRDNVDYIYNNLVFLLNNPRMNTTALKIAMALYLCFYPLLK